MSQFTRCESVAFSSRNDASARRERNAFAKEIINRLSRIEQAIPSASCQPPGLEQHAGSQIQMQSVIDKLQEQVLALTCRLERMEQLLFQADFQSFAKIDKLLKKDSTDIAAVQLFDIFEARENACIQTSSRCESLKLDVDTSCCLSTGTRYESDTVMSDDADAAKQTVESGQTDFDGPSTNIVAEKHEARTDNEDWSDAGGDSTKRNSHCVLADKYLGRMVQLSPENVHGGSHPTSVALTYQGRQKKAVVTKQDRMRIIRVEQEYAFVDFLDDQGTFICQGKIESDKLQDAKVIDERLRT